MPALSTLLYAESRLRRAMHAAALLIFAGIVIAGSMPGARAEVGEYASGLVLHSLAYASLATLWFLGSSGSGLQRALKAVLAIALMGAIDEGVQHFLPYRSGTVHDWLVDVSAATVAATLLAMLVARLPMPDALRPAPVRPR
ncbi:VanZ family protein [Massilia aurea]|uniref:VanZ family protein n=1 Tax=Massilia aurea TaxID=373040 RepID=UPI003461836C